MVKAALTVFVLVVTVISFMFTYGAKTITERNNGARLTAAGVLALAILGACCW